MVVYWFMFFWPAILSLTVGEGRFGTRRGILIGVFFIVFVILIGLRYDTGGDWGAYQSYAESLYNRSLSDSLFDYEPGFVIVTWISSHLGWEGYGSTTFCAIVLVYAVIRFARHQNRFWLTIAAATPYLLIVIGMGYVRQAAAIGFIILAILNFQFRKTWTFLADVVLATVFHVSSLILLPIMAAITFKRNPLLLVVIGIGSIPAIYLVMGSRYDVMMNTYVNAEYNSSGTLVRIFMNIVPSLIFLLYRKRFKLDTNTFLLWFTMAVLSCASLIGFALSPSSTLVDRLGLYLIPIQLLVFGNLPTVLSEDNRYGAMLITIAEVIYFALILGVWLVYAVNAIAWVPYKSLLTQ